MGWDSTLAFSQSLDYQSSYALIDTMGSMMKDNIIGGQIIYSITDENWKINHAIVIYVRGKVIPGTGKSHTQKRIIPLNAQIL